MKTIQKTFLLSLLAFFFLAEPLVAQTENNGPYKMIFQLTSSDTTAHKALMKQIKNITSVEPKTEIEIVCHGPGLSMLVENKSIVADKINAFSEKGVAFKACEFSMKERKVDKTEIIKSAGYVNAGILHIVNRQANGWYYIKAGF